MSITAVRAPFVVDDQHDDPATYAAWLAATRPLVTALLASTTASPNGSR